MPAQSGDDAVAADPCDEVVEGTMMLGRLHQLQGRADRFGDLGQRSDDGFPIGRSIAIAGRHVAGQLVRIVEEQGDLPGRDARAVERRHGKADKAPLGQSLDIGACRVGKVDREIVHATLVR